MTNSYHSLIMRHTLLSGLLLDKLDGMLNLPWVASDDEQLLIGIWWRITIQLNMSARLPVNLSDSLASWVYTQQCQTVHI